MKIKTSKQKIRQQIQTHKRKHMKTWSSFCAGQLLLDLGPALECGWHAEGCSITENFPFPAGIMANGFLAGAGLCVHPPLLCLVGSCGGLVCAVMVSACSYVHQGCCVWRRCFFVFISRLWLLPFFQPSLQHRSLSLERTGLMKTSPLGLIDPKSLTPACCPAVGLCVDYHLPQQEASLESSGALVWVSPSQLPFFPYRQERLSLGPYCAAHALSHWE